MGNKTRRLVYVSRCYRNLTGAGNKAKTDNEATMEEMGFANIGLPQRTGRNGLFVFLYDLLGVIKACCTMRKGDVLLLQYPVKKYFSLLCQAAHRHGAKVVAVIHDLGSFRRRKLTVSQEIHRLSNADCIIASNEVMAQWLKDNGLTRPTVPLGLFDYRSSAPIPQDNHKVQSSNFKPQSVVYAGSLNVRKNAFFLHLPSVIRGMEVHVYGNGEAMPSLKDNPNIVFHGFTPADEFIAHCEGAYGLVWDGDSLDTCSGPFGEYLRYNSPHKASFYLRAGLPVIVWKEAAIAPIIEHEGIGFTIASLYDLPEKLKTYDENAYAAMRQNVAKIAEKLNQGCFFKEAMTKACRLLQN